MSLTLFNIGSLVGVTTSTNARNHCGSGGGQKAEGEESYFWYEEMTVSALSAFFFYTVAAQLYADSQRESVSSREGYRSRGDVR